MTDKAPGDPGEANRGIGQERVGEAGPGSVQRPPLAPAAGGPGTGDAQTIGEPKHRRPMADPTRDVAARHYGHGFMC